jgi:GNAT superfamily N-acetyltransferase
VSEVVLEPLKAAHLPLVEPWFDDPETRRRLGGRDWPVQALALAASPPPGTDRYGLLARIGQEAVGLADLEVAHDGAASLALLVAPGRRRCGVGSAILAQVLALPAVAGRPLALGVEPGNAASMRLLERAGLVPNEVDADGYVVYGRAG